MDDASSFPEKLAFLAQTEPGRVGISLFILGIAFLLCRFLHYRARLGAQNPADLRRRRINLVLAKNLIFVTALILIGYTWATKIAGAALSLAAVAGAMLLVSKEFLANALGSALLAVSRPYGVGDLIELAGIRGRVVDTDILATTLVEMLECQQMTGRSVVIPHAMLLVHPVRNLTATGAYVVFSLKVPVCPEDNMAALEAALLKSANEVCGAWMLEAQRHFDWIEKRDLLELPGARPRVLVQMPKSTEYVLFLQYPCRPGEHVSVEQEILHRYLQYREPGMEQGIRKPACKESEEEAVTLAAA